MNLMLYDAYLEYKSMSLYYAIQWHRVLFSVLFWSNSGVVQQLEK